MKTLILFLLAVDPIAYKAAIDTATGSQYEYPAFMQRRCFAACYFADPKNPDNSISVDVMPISDLDAAYVNAAKSNPDARHEVTYAVRGPDWFVVSGTDPMMGYKTIFYWKVFKRSGHLVRLRIQFDEHDKAAYDPVIKRVAGTFKAN